MAAPGYMVRAVALQINPSGSYLNPSEGVFVQINLEGSGGAVPVTLSAAITPTGIELSWNSRSNSLYHVEAKSPDAQDAWADISGPLRATTTATTFVDATFFSRSARLYRVVSE